MKTITMHDFRNGPAPAPGSASEAYVDETDFQVSLWQHIKQILGY